MNYTVVEQVSFMDLAKEKKKKFFFVLFLFSLTRSMKKSVFCLLVWFAFGVLFVCLWFWFTNS